MPSGPPRRLLAALLGLAAFAVAVGWFGIGKPHRRPQTVSAPPAQQAEAAQPETKPEQALNAAPPTPPILEELAEAKPDQLKEGSTASPPNQAQTAPPAEAGKVNGP